MDINISIVRNSNSKFPFVQVNRSPGFFVEFNIFLIYCNHVIHTSDACLCIINDNCLCVLYIAEFFNIINYYSRGCAVNLHILHCNLRNFPVCIFSVKGHYASFFKCDCCIVCKWIGFFIVFFICSSDRIAVLGVERNRSVSIFICRDPDCPFIILVRNRCLSNRGHIIKVLYNCIDCGLFESHYDFIFFETLSCI